jgi:predicted kinase
MNETSGAERHHRPRLYLVCGLPGAGKTTRSKRIVDTVRAIHLSPDEWITRFGVSLLDYGFRVKLQDCMLEHAARLLRCKLSVVIEFGSWHRHEREHIRQLAAREGAATELHFLNAPIPELADRVRARGGWDANALITVVLPTHERFEIPQPDETSRFDRYIGPDDEWTPELEA